MRMRRNNKETQEIRIKLLPRHPSDSFAPGIKGRRYRTLR